jgi:hypothetical protein
MTTAGDRQGSLQGGMRAVMSARVSRRRRGGRARAARSHRGLALGGGPNATAAEAPTCARSALGRQASPTILADVQAGRARAYRVMLPAERAAARVRACTFHASWSTASF